VHKKESELERSCLYLFRGGLNHQPAQAVVRGGQAFPAADRFPGTFIMTVFFPGGRCINVKYFSQ